AYEGMMESATTFLSLVMDIKGDDPWLAGAAPSLADYFLGPVIFYVSISPAAERLMAVPGMADWWARLQSHPTFKATEPDLG
ncbi:MAG: glutathione S-transferase domain-containing protein, partial [Pseudomonadota bacterium]